ncbi:MAG: Abi-alpha family protein [Brevinema sp.]
MQDFITIINEWNPDFIYLAPFLKTTIESGLAYDTLKEVVAKIPVINRMIPAKNIAIPCLEGIVLNTDNEILQNMFISLLTNSMDKTKQDLSHPAFPKILSQLSVDEVILLYYMSSISYGKIERIKDYKWNGLQQKVRSSIELEFDYQYNIELLNINKIFNFIVSHLHSLGIIKTEESDSRQYPIIFTLTLNDVGKQFLKSCLNEEAEELLKDLINSKE